MNTNATGQLAASHQKVQRALIKAENAWAAWRGAGLTAHITPQITRHVTLHDVVTQASTPTLTRILTLVILTLTLI